MAARRRDVQMRFVAPASTPESTRHWSPQVRELLESPGEAVGRWLPYRVHGGPGTGKTSLVVDLAVRRLLHDWVDPESVLVLAASRRAATELRAQITARTLAVDDGSSLPRASREPIVRTVHSYAFAILRLQAAAHDNPPPRLITGSEQDAVIRELLAGDVDDGAQMWPEHLRPALSTNGFAQAVRDIIMRAAERGFGPEDLMDLGQRYQRPEWVAAGRAYQQYEYGTLLRGSVGVAAPQATAPAVDAAELVGSALTAFATDPDLLARERHRIDYLLVDDAQHLDPQAAQLIRAVGAGARQAVIVGDSDQSIYSFRGASAAFIDELVDTDSQRDLLLENNFRQGSEIAAVSAAISGRLAGARPHPVPHAVGPDPLTTPVTVAVYGSVAKEATAIADRFRRAHLHEGIAWSDMAVIVRSVPRAIAPLRRALRAAGVPVITPASEMPIGRQRAVAAMVLAMLAAVRQVGPAQVLDLLSGPLGGADPAELRRLRRGVRRAESARGGDRDSATVLALIVNDPEVAQDFLADLTDVEKFALRSVLKVIDAIRAAVARRDGVEEVLWSAWSATGVASRWTALALRGGMAGDQADRDLDAMVAMFDAAANFTDSLPAGSLDGFIEYLAQLQIPTESRLAQTNTDAVTVMSAHASVGREWDVVAVAGVQEGLWPSLRSRGSILHTPELIDLLDGIDAEALPNLSRSAAALAEERRLLLVACSRARRQLIISAVDDGSGDDAPSRFLTELSGYAQADEPELPVQTQDQPVLSLSSLVAELRAVVCGVTEGEKPTAREQSAATLLARLADAGVPGAHPRQWFGLAEPSSDDPLFSTDGPIGLSPSTVESLSNCSLRWLLERYGGRDAGDDHAASQGTLVHTLVQAVAGKVPTSEVTAALARAWDATDSSAPWYSRHELARTEEMLANFRSWLKVSRSDLAEEGVEVEVSALLPAVESDDPDVRIRGRIDRLETDHQGRPVVVDVKTGRTPIRAADAEVHPQLATYQLALSLGGVPDVGTEPGGGMLVYVNNSHKSTGAAQREQAPLDTEQLQDWADHVREVARSTIGPEYTATLNPTCIHCSVVASCPAQLAGRPVTGGGE